MLIFITYTTVDCDWATWGMWSDCALLAGGACGTQGSGDSNRTRSHDPAADNGGEECEETAAITSMEEERLCCADSDTDADECTDPNQVCLTGN